MLMKLIPGVVCRGGGGSYFVKTTLCWQKKRKNGGKKKVGAGMPNNKISKRPHLSTYKQLKGEWFPKNFQIF